MQAASDTHTNAAAANENHSQNSGDADGGSDDEEYDPTKPNDYQKIISRKLQLKKEIETKRKILERA